MANKQAVADHLLSTSGADTLIELAERCEKDPQPSRDLDYAIHEALGNCLHSRIIVTFDSDDDEADGKDECTKCGAGPPHLAPKRYTRSMDEALKLTPVGWHTHLALQDRHSRRWKWSLRGGFGVTAEARGATATLALCAAALRARAAMEAGA